MTHTLTTLLELAETDEGREKIRVMVAELAGWQKCPGSLVCWEHDKKVATRASLPRFTTSLDAIASAEAGLTDEEWDRYAELLFDIAENESLEMDFIDIALSRAYVSASALHRAIAFVLTKQETKGEE